MYNHFIQGVCNITYSKYLLFQTGTTIPYKLVVKPFNDIYIFIVDDTDI